MVYDVVTARAGMVSTLAAAECMLERGWVASRAGQGRCSSSRATHSTWWVIGKRSKARIAVSS